MKIGPAGKKVGNDTGYPAPRDIVTCQVGAYRGGWQFPGEDGFLGIRVGGKRANLLTLNFSPSMKYIFGEKPSKLPRRMLSDRSVSTEVSDRYRW